MAFYSNEDCAIALFHHLKNTGKIEGSVYDYETILHDINNLRGAERLQILDRNHTTKPFFDHIGLAEFFDDAFAFDKAVSPDVFLKVTVGQDFPEQTSFSVVRDVLDENGLSELWDYPTDEIDEATNNLGDNMYLLAVSFYESDGYFARVFEITDEMAKRFWRLKDIAKGLDDHASLKHQSLESKIQSASTCATASQHSVKARAKDSTPDR